MRPSRKVVVVQEWSILQLRCSSPVCNMTYAVQWINTFEDDYTLEQIDRIASATMPDHCPYCGQEYREDKYFERVGR